MNKKDNLDNIRRKAPAPRKTAQAVDDVAPGQQQLEYIGTQLAATQQQLQHLNSRYNDLAQGHVILLDQVMQMQKFVKTRDDVMQRVMGFLHTVDDQRRNSRIEPFTGTGMNGEPLSNQIEEQPATFLVEADDLLHKYPITELPDKALEHMADDFNRLRDDYSTPPSNNDQDGSTMEPRSKPNHHHLQYTSGDIVDSGVYPVGDTNGIDPINSDHIHNIPYPLPAEDMLTANPMPEMLPQGSPNLPRKRNAMDTVWGPRKPRILLVEDDKICARIGSKFLQGFECGVDIAVSWFVHRIRARLTCLARWVGSCEQNQQRSQSV